jgi:aldose 1-epimerase
MEEGYPGNLTATVRYGLTWDNRLIADYSATLDADCPLNFTNHAYFNLAGEGAGLILDHEIKLYCSGYLEVDENLIPTGKVLPVQGTAYDFTSRKSIGRDIKSTGMGYDHCFSVDGEVGKLRPVAEVYEPNTGRSMKQWTTKPGVQLYTGNFLTGSVGKDGSVYDKHTGFCLETQHFPDAPNQPHFASAFFGPNRPYHERTELAFAW